MKYAVWIVRLAFAAWMIPSGLNHFYPLFPQPMGTQPLSHELIVALLDSHLFDLVKAVELVAGLAVLLGLYSPLALMVCMPVSFCVFYWDAPLEGWGSRAAIYGYSVLACNVLLCLAFVGSYRSLFAARAKPVLIQLVPVGRVIFGIWMFANGVSYFFFQLWSQPTGHQPLAIELMDALVHSRLLDVALAIQLVAGALILAGALVPLALSVVMPVSTCALYWSAVLDHRPVGTVLALAAFALNGLLMLAYLGYYKDVLKAQALSLGESSDGSGEFSSLFVNGGGRLARGAYGSALVTLLVVFAFYAFLVKGLTAQWCMVVLLYPAGILLATRLRDMGLSAWLLVLPGGLMLAAFGIWLHSFGLGASIDAALPSVALAVAAGFALWGCLGKTQA